MSKDTSVINPISLAISLSVVLVAILISLSPIGSAIDRFYLDSLFSFRGVEESPRDIVIVGIDEDSFAEINQQWPWSCSLHASLLNSLYSAGADVVAMDVIFSEPSFCRVKWVISGGAAIRKGNTSVPIPRLT